MSAVLKKIYTDVPDISVNEIMRYAKCGRLTPKVHKLILDCVDMTADKLAYSVCYAVLSKEELFSAIGEPCSELSARLVGCDGALVFAATVGAHIDRLIEGRSFSSPSAALMLQAVGTERIEALCDAFCGDMGAELAEKGMRLHRRFSAGYGPMPLELQTAIFKLLEPEKNIGVYLNSAMLMKPTKSVTAIAGISKME